MNTSPNSSAEAWRAEWRRLNSQEWCCDADKWCAFIDIDGSWDVYRKIDRLDGGQLVRRIAHGKAEGAVSAMEAADLAIAKLEGKG